MQGVIKDNKEAKKVCGSMGMGTNLLIYTKIIWKERLHLNIKFRHWQRMETLMRI